MSHIHVNGPVTVPSSFIPCNNDFNCARRNVSVSQMERVYEVTQIHLLQKMTLPTLQLLTAHSFTPKRSSSAHNYKGDRGCLWHGFVVVALVRFLLLDVSSCHFEQQMKCHFLFRLDMPVLWNWRTCVTSETVSWLLYSIPCFDLWM
jgi:hypothetical protein